MAVRVKLLKGQWGHLSIWFSSDKAYAAFSFVWPGKSTPAKSLG
jgi:hypothetical protein